MVLTAGYGKAPTRNPEGAAVIAGSGSFFCDRRSERLLFVRGPVARRDQMNDKANPVV